jgi:hypothetical protein
LVAIHPTFLPVNVRRKKSPSQRPGDFFSFLKQFLLENECTFLNYCAGWGYIGVFTKVLTNYQIYHA